MKSVRPTVGMPDTALVEGNQFRLKVILHWIVVRIKSGGVPKAKAGDSVLGGGHVAS